MEDWWGVKKGLPLSGDWWNSGGSEISKLLPSATISSAPTGQAARDLDFTQSGAGLANAGIDEKDMFPRYEKLRAHKDEKAGGNRQLWKNLSRWTSTPQGANLDPEQAQLFNVYHTTGKRDPRLKDQTVAAALDWGIRDNTRGQVHKESFLDSVLGKLLVGAGQIGLSFVPGVGPALSAGLGGITGAMNGGGPLGALTGAVGGYGLGKGAQWLSNGVQTGFGALNNVNALMGSETAARAGTGTANTAFSLGSGGRAIEKGASATAAVLRERKRRKEMEEMLRLSSGEEP